MTKKVNRMGHQGDVFFQKLDMSDAEFDKLMKSGEASKIDVDEHNCTTVLKGEATNHHHVFRDNSAIELGFIRQEGNVQVMVARINKPANLEHYHVKEKALTKEHDTVMFPPGIYEFRSQEETSSDGILRPVVD